MKQDVSRHLPFRFFVFFVFAFAWSTFAKAETLRFNDLGPGCSSAIPSAYHGLSWSSNFRTECNSDYSDPSSFNNGYGAPSGFAATNGSAPGSGLSEVAIGSGTFDLLGASFSSFAGSDTFQAYSAESLVLYGYRPGDDIDSPSFVTAFDLDPTQFVAFHFSWTGINALLLGSGTGPSADLGTIYGVDGLSWLMTDADVSINSTAPEPDTLLLLGSTLAGLALLARRKSFSRKLT